MSEKKNSIISKILLSIDQFGIKPRLNFNSTEKFTTLSGGIISFLFYIVIILGFSYFSQELFNKRNPALIQSGKFDQTPGRFNLTKKNFAIFLGIEDKKFIYYRDLSIYRLDVILQVVYRVFDSEGKVSFNYSSIPLRNEQCELERHFPNFIESFKGQALSGLNCIHPDDVDLIYLESAFGEAEYAYVYAEFNSCRNGTGVVCKPQEVINSYLDGSYTAVNFIDTIFDPSNYTTPYKFVRKDYFTTISNKFFKSWTFYFNNIDYNTDTGFLMDDIFSLSYLSFEKTYEVFDLRVQENFLSILIRLSNIRFQFNRKYIKIQDVLAQMGGLISGLKILLKIILSSYFTNKYYTSIINKLYILGDERKKFINEIENNFDSQNKSRIHIIPDRLQIGSIYKVNLQEIDKGSYISTEKLKQIDLNKKKFKLSIFENIKVTICKNLENSKNISIRFFSKGKERIKDNTDIIRVNSIIEEIGILKKVLFDNKANNLLTYIRQNKILSLNEEHFLNVKYRGEDVVNSYNELDSNQINNRLKSSFEETLNSLIKSILK